jgi:iron-sulfur cluster assembly accessory protein
MNASHDEATPLSYASEAVAEASVADDALPTAPFPIVLTARAGDQVRQAMAQEKLVAHGLRVGVTGGGCSGLQYMLDFSENHSTADFVLAQHGIDVMIDPFSAAHLAGTTIDYVDGLSGAGFKFENPNVVRACGCGSSFQT